MPPRAQLGHAFGVEVEAGVAIPRLPPRDRERGARPLVRIERAPAAELRRTWPAGEAVEALRRELPDATLVMLVERHDDAGFLVWAPRYGRHHVAADGALVRSALPRVPEWRWERLLFAQVLPLASALRGRELFHASAVALDGHAIAFVGMSGAGKSSVAAHLVARGAELLTDDVLALEISSGAVVAHHGARLVGLDRRELARIGGPDVLGATLGRSEKTYLDVPVAATPYPVAALYFLTPSRRAAVEIVPTEETAARLLGGSFLAYLDDPQHLVRHLDVCAAIAAGVPTFDVLAGRSVGAAGVAEAIESHAAAVTGSSG